MVVNKLIEFSLESFRDCIDFLRMKYISDSRLKSHQIFINAVDEGISVLFKKHNNNKPEKETVSIEDNEDEDYQPIIS